MFDVFGMMENYDERKVGRYQPENSDILVSTAAVSDSAQPYETAIATENYGITVVEMYDTKIEAEDGHERWVALAQAGKLPEERPEDVGTSTTAEFLKSLMLNDKEYDKEN